MAIAHPELISQSEAAAPMTYEEYMAWSPEYKFYSIVDGVRSIMAGASEEHQEIAYDICTAFRAYTQLIGDGKAVIAPRDVLISRTPLRTRQPDVLLISSARHAQNPSRQSGAPMSAAPELVVEVISDSERNSVFAAKLTDYRTVNVLECWKVLPNTRTVEVLRLDAQDGWVLAATYTSGQALQSLVFAGLGMTVDNVFAY